MCYICGYVAYLFLALERGCFIIARQHSTTLHAEGAPNLLNPRGKFIRVKNVFERAKVAMANAFGGLRLAPVLA